jgi:aldose 1-epimerase
MLEVRAGANRVLVDPERGGRLASWSLDGRELLVGPPTDDDRSIHWGCFLMAPWPGRLADGRFDWHGRTIQLRRTHGRHAIHGLVWHRPWTVDDARVDRVDLSIELPRDEWPMGGYLRQRVALTPTSLRLEAEIEAVEPMPAALGWHPWFLRHGDPRLRVDADRFQVTRAMIPTGELGSVYGRADLREGPPLGTRRLDLAYVEARSPAVVTWPDLELRIDFQPSPAPLVVYTPPASFCVEPLTALPSALARPQTRARQGVRVLGSGEILTSRVALSWRAR